ncbi:MAG: hypothetical protein ACP5JG_07395 [Anaerolineae bacterium]
MLTRDALTHRQVGWLLILLGLGGGVALLAAGRLGGGAWSGIGPLERALLAAAGGVALAGGPLLRRGSQPAVVAQEPHYRSAPAAPAARAPAALSWAIRGLQVLALVAFLGYFAVYVTYAVDLFKWPYDYDQGESFELYDAVLHSRGEWPYRDSSIFPFYASNYPPVFHVFNALLFPIFGETLLSGRLLSFAVTLLTAFAIGWTVWRRTGGVFIPLISGLGYLGSNFVYHVGPLYRQQITMVFLEVLSIGFIANVGHPRYGRRNLLLGLLSLFLAGYTKQLAVFTAAAVFGFLLLRHPRRAVLLVVAFGVAFGTVFLAINWATEGYWWINTISANVNAYLFPQLWGLTRSWLKTHTLFVVLAVAMVLYETYVARISAYSLWFIASLGTGLMSGKWGAGEAYWITSVAAAIILTGFALGRLRAWVLSQTWRMPQGALWRGLILAVLPLLYLLQATRMVHLPTEGTVWGPIARALGVADISVYADYPYYDAVGYSQVGHLMLPRDYDGGAKIMAYVEDSEGPVLSEEAAFTMLAGKTVVTNPTQLLNLYNNGLLDTQPLEMMIRREEFGLVVMRAQFYPPPVLTAIGEHYGLVEHVPMNGFNYIVMKPLGRVKATE